MALRGSHIYLRYADNGQLAAAVDVQKIFDPFYTSQRGSGRRMGLGLYQVHNIVTQLFRGRVNVSMDTGLVFEFELPYAN
jgi:signal transduction histidine kinase